MRFAILQIKNAFRILPEEYYKKNHILKINFTDFTGLNGCVEPSTYPWKTILQR